MLLPSAVPSAFTGLRLHQSVERHFVNAQLGSTAWPRWAALRARGPRCSRVIVVCMSAARAADLLVLAAHAPELVGMRATLGTGLAGVIRGMRVVCATVGVGMPVAGAGA